MSAVALVTGLLWVLVLCLWAAYVVEAFRESPGQGLLTALLPFYVLYYACIRSRRSPAGAWVLTLAALMVLWLSHY
jgi:hypothetical protein